MPRTGSARNESESPDEWNSQEHTEIKHCGIIKMPTDLRESSKDVLRTDTNSPNGSRLRVDGSQVPESEKHPRASHRRNLSSMDVQDSLSSPIQQMPVGEMPDLARESTEPEVIAPIGFKIAIKANGRILLIDSSDVIVVKAQASYVILHRQTGSIRGRGSISAMARDLEPRGFVRIHRSVLVNRACILEIRRAAGGEYLLYTSDGIEYRVSRTCMRNLRAIAQVWIGTGYFPRKPDGRSKPLS